MAVYILYTYTHNLKIISVLTSIYIKMLTFSKKLSYSAWQLQNVNAHFIMLPSQDVKFECVIWNKLNKKYPSCSQVKIHNTAG